MSDTTIAVLFVVDHTALFVYLASAVFVSASLLIKVCFQELKRPVGKNMLQSFSIDFLIRIKNAARAGHKKMVAPASNFCISITDLLKRYGYVTDYSVSQGPKREITLELAMSDNQPKLTEVKIFSKPGRRLYEKVSALPWGKTPKSLIIVSTSSGVMSQKEAKAKKLGGEIIAEIY